MTRLRLLALSAAAWAALTAVWWVTHPSEGFGSALLLTSVLVAASALLLRCFQAVEEREWRIDHDGAHADQARELAGLRDDAEKARRIATRAATEKRAEVVDIRTRLRDHVADPDAHTRAAGVPAQRTEKR